MPPSMHIRPQYQDILAKHTVSAGDVFYDDPDAYGIPWTEALRTINHMVIVFSAAPGPDGIVVISIRKPSADRKALEIVESRTMTQRRFALFIQNYPAAEPVQAPAAAPALIDFEPEPTPTPALLEALF